MYVVNNHMCIFERTNIYMLNITIIFADLYSGYYNGCGKNNTRADLNILQSLNSSRGVCGSVCSFTDDCIGFNYQSATKRYPS